MVMAGTGEINCLRRLRYAYGMYTHVIRYGTHTATHMSLGLLFLGGGRYTLGNSDAAIACMVTAFYPRFPHVSSDNKCYLQALRHLWVLAIEPRCLIARDVDTKEVVYLPVKIKVDDGLETAATQLIAPTLIPDLDRLRSIRVDTPRYWPFYLDIANFPRHKESLLRNQTLYVKRRSAFLSYTEDPKGSRSLFVRSGSSTADAATLDFPQLTDIKTHPAGDLNHFISSFSNDTFFLAFADHLCRGDGTTRAEKVFGAYCHAALLDALLQDKPRTLQSHLTLYQYRTMAPQSRYFNLKLHDLRFTADFYNKTFDRRFSGRYENNPRNPLVRETTVAGALHALDQKLESIRSNPTFLATLSQYARGEVVSSGPIATSIEADASRALAWYLSRNSVPVATLLVVLRELAEQAHAQCLGVSPPEGTSDAALLDRGIKEVLHSTGTQMTTTMGTGWSVRSLDEIVQAWSRRANGV
jgi:anaphase-promoting complex subunit 1